MSKITLAAVVYIAGYSLTCGWIAADPHPLCPGTAQCGRGEAWFAGIYGSFGWPLYWTEKVFEQVRTP